MRWTLLILALLWAPLHARETFPSQALKAAGHVWTYSWAAPEDLPDKLPLVLVLHGTGGSARYYLENAGWAKKARDEEFLAVAPEGLPLHIDEPPDFRHNPRVWNTGSLEPGSERAQVDDLAFFKALLEDLKKRFPLDPQRIYCTGHSNGAAMTFRLTQALPDQFAAIAAVASLCPSLPDFHLPHPVPTLVVLGTKDPIIPVDGGEGHSPWGSFPCPGASKGLAPWAAAMGYPEQPEKHDSQLDYGPDLTALLVEGQGHNWPGSIHGMSPDLAGPDGGHLDATRRIWDFFCEHAP